jgi:4-hydroxybenzoate polyprenyltransferase
VNADSVLPSKAPRQALPAWLRELRPHHWIKNALVVIPLAAAHELGAVGALVRVAVAFAAFSLAASGLYVVNDLLDLEADRRHPSNSNRPLAAGELTRGAAVALAVAAWVGGAVLAAQLGARFAGVVAGYVLLMVAYSLWLKRLVLVDALVLAAGYAARVAAGGIAVSIRPSPWLIAFCVCVFFSLALVKRYSELARNRERDGAGAHARGYEAVDLPMVATFGVVSGYLAVLVLALYLTTGQTFSQLYSRPAFIGLTALLLLYWISYVWLLANRGRMPDDPVLFALRDRRSRLLVVLMGLCAFLAV